MRTALSCWCSRAWPRRHRSGTLRDPFGHEWTISQEIEKGAKVSKEDVPALKRGIVNLEAHVKNVQKFGVPVVVALNRFTSDTQAEIDTVLQMVRRYPETFELALTADDVERIFKKGKIASLIGMEGGHSIDNSLAALRMFNRLGARYMTLTHSKNTAWADSCSDTPASNGLSPFGEQVVHEMNWLGMLVDLSHTSPDTMADAIRVTDAPVIFSHSSSRAVNDVVRNVPDEILKLLPGNGGLVMVTFVPGFLSPKVAAWNKLQTAEEDRLKLLTPGNAAAVTTALAAWTTANPSPRATVTDIADHIDHIKQVAGIDHIGLGGDFDGITAVPLGMEDVSTYPVLTAELLRRGYSEDDVRKILGLNVLRVMRQVEKVSKKLQSERGPSTVLFQK